MNERHRQPATAREPSTDDEGLRTMITEAGPRPEVPAEDLAEIRAAAEEEWRELVGEQAGSSGRAWRFVLPLAAGLAIALAGAWWWTITGSGPEAAPPVIARLQKLTGELRIATDRGELATDLGAGVPAGSTLETGAEGSAAALEFADGRSLRLDSRTSVRFVSRAVVELEHGALYIDSGPGAGRGIEITTSLGVVREIGTRYEVRLDTAAGRPLLRVRVRDGAVALSSDSGRHEATGGEELTRTAGGEVVRSASDVYGPSWEWVLAAAPRPAFEEMTLAALLEWVSAETGWTVRFAEPDLEILAAKTRLQGATSDWRPDEALDIYLPGSGLTQSIANGVLSIDRLP